MYYIGFVGKALDPRTDSIRQSHVPAEASATHKVVDGVGSSHGVSATPRVQ